MKDRILDYLYDFSNGQGGLLAEELKNELALDDQLFRERSQELLAAILHGYAQFSISTIDAFFQKVIRSFTREAGLVGDYRLEIETDIVLEEVMDRLMEELGSNENLTRWLVDFANENLENDRAWDVRSSLIQFSQEIFSENFKAIEQELHATASKKNFFDQLMAELRKHKFEFQNFVKSNAREAVEIIQRNGLVKEDFKYAAGGVYGYFINLTKIAKVNDYSEKGKRPENEYQSSDNWPNKDTPHKALMIELANDQLIPLLNKILRYWDQNFQKALTAEVALNNFYAFGLLFDISRKLQEYKEENSLMLLADAPKFLNALIGDTDTPFIYEKVGSFYKNFLIDEFQDTSGMQWKNFVPLIANSLDQGLTCTVVGDVKQAIYRWRGGDLSLLQSKLEEQIGSHRILTQELNRNFRSTPQIVQFNNSLFKSISTSVTAALGDTMAEQVYHDVEQKTSAGEAGYVNVKFISEEADENWKDLALVEMTQTMERLQESGIPLKDIAILVRKKEEGMRVVSHLVTHKHSAQAKTNCKYDVISSESLRLDGASTVNLLLGAMRYLANPDNAIARAQLGYEFARLHEPDRVLTEVFSVTNQINFENNLPDGFAKAKLSLKKLPLFELTETLIGMFDLGRQKGELAYLQAFQDLILDFTGRERSDLNSFLEWWEINKGKKSIQVPDQVDAAQIFTIHKSKGLQFKYVVIPFCSWNVDHEIIHSQTLWVKSDQSIFKDAGYLPVKYSSTLEQTYFAEAYKEEHSRALLDNLNLLYVAFTRAERGMIVLAPDMAVKNTKGTVAKWLHDGISSSLDLVTHWNKSAGEWRTGEITADAIQTTQQTPAVSLKSYPSTSWRDKLVIRQLGKNFFAEETGVAAQSQQKRNYGIHLHHLLSRIYYLEDVPKVLEDIQSEGWATKEEIPELQKVLENVLEQTPVRSWFSKEWEVRTEVPILLPGGKESRIDRLLLKDQTAVVIDFKTGSPQRDDQQQVKEYMETLRSMNFVLVEGHLLYLKTNEVVSVPPGKVKVLKKKNDSQLGIDF